jgi:two-component system CAI-1 autoinducer sensor kinase/phosphatase CqsS
MGLGRGHLSHGGESQAIMHHSLASIYRRLGQSVVESLEYAKPKIFVFGVVGVIGYPLYYFVWAYIFPQPYENLLLRLACAAVAFPTLFIGKWPARLRPFLPVYWYVALTLCVPTFFTYMALHNGYNPVWATSAVAALVLIILVMDTANALAMILLGKVLAFLAYASFSGEAIPWAAFVLQLPVQVFALVASIVFDVANERERRAKLVSAMAFGGQIAHEVGTPLQSIRLGAREAIDLLPRLSMTYDAARKAGLDIPLQQADLQFLESAAKRIDKEVDYALLIIDMMLTKAGSMDSGEEQFTRFQTMRCVQSAIERYAFKSDVERRWVNVDTEVEFRMRAIELLFVHVLFNLLKNSIYALRAAHRRDAGEIRIWAERGDTFNFLHFRDNGVGIPRHVISNIFDPFFTTQSRGTGLGLHFCKLVMRRFGGDIVCDSQPGVFTEFILSIPVDDNEPREEASPFSVKGVERLRRRPTATQRRHVRKRMVVRRGAG